MGVVLSASGLPTGIEPTVLSTTVGVIQPGQTQQGKLVFAIPRNWTEKSLDIDVTTSKRLMRGEAELALFQESLLSMWTRVDPFCQPP